MFKKYIIPIAIVFLFVSGCAPATFVRPDYCKDQTSLIYDTADKTGINPETIFTFLSIGSTIAIQKRLVKPDVLVNALTAMEGYLKDPLTYRTFVVIAQTYVMKLNSSAGEMILLLSPFFSALDKPLPISDCDRQIFLNCVTNVKGQILDLLATSM